MASKRDEQRAPIANILDSIGANAPAVGASTPALARPKNARLDGLVRSKDVALIPLAKIKPDPRQPRKEFDRESISRLAASLKDRGQLQPIRVRWSEREEAYMVIVGERRWRAAGEAGLESLACVIHEGPIDEAQLRAIQLIENLHREDLSEIDQAKAMRALIDAHDWSQRQLAAELGIRQGTVSRMLSLLNLAPAVQKKVQDGKIAAASAYPISRLETPEEQVEVARAVEEGGLGRDEATRLVESKLEPPAPRKGRGGAPAPRAKKLKTEMLFNSSGYKFTVTKRTGIEPAELLAALRSWADQVESRLEPAEAGG